MCLLLVVVEPVPEANFIPAYYPGYRSVREPVPNTNRTCLVCDGTGKMVLVDRDVRPYGVTFKSVDVPCVACHGLGKRIRKP